MPALEAEVARLQVEVQDRNKGLRDAQHEEGLARAQVHPGAVMFICMLVHMLPCSIHIVAVCLLCNDETGFVT